ncbi:uncharacterized protein PHALS_10882 [Plasmopara halstedii]|uniref:Uncharacterized protein n=1 Tax=Plasmopara halstedii TaxID=4781 RepID=A0A0P1AHJ6_PLAHL|nr:uncharacterized protein PHALS_10882 [Plasmopara halstedii]CEG40698.1 hypothetical protein PHALS_10882 [Plasmopara halstedii]|eukprot:XP_024577067.1 hypothetical protein PHALS_10882 [Plasmopara halstedii]
MEDDTANLGLNDDEIIALFQEAEGEENDDQENKDVEKQLVTNLEKLKSLAITASLLKVTNPTNTVVLWRIRELQKSQNDGDSPGYHQFVAGFILVQHDCLALHCLAHLQNSCL